MRDPSREPAGVSSPAGSLPFPVGRAPGPLVPPDRRRQRPRRPPTRRDAREDARPASTSSPTATSPRSAPPPGSPATTIPTASPASPPRPPRPPGCTRGPWRTIPSWSTGSPASRPLWGNDGSTLRAVRDPIAVAEALRRAGLPCPRVRLEPEGLPRDGSWLVKPLASAGGEASGPSSRVRDPPASPPTTRSGSPARACPPSSSATGRARGSAGSPGSGSAGRGPLRLSGEPGPLAGLGSRVGADRPPRRVPRGRLRPRRPLRGRLHPARRPALAGGDQPPVHGLGRGARAGAATVTPGRASPGVRRRRRPFPSPPGRGCPEGG